MWNEESFLKHFPRAANLRRPRLWCVSMGEDAKKMPEGTVNLVFEVLGCKIQDL